VFPIISDLAAIGLGFLGVPRSHQQRLYRLVESLADGTLVLDVGADWQRARNELSGVPGVDAWATEMIAMQGLGDPDAFPSTDPDIRIVAAALGLPHDPQALDRYAERWRPWRSYAAQYLWATRERGSGRRS
jgi:AraC family transcriptional regulator of adaptative response / DNA-3-methyladenine glycosylase II